MASIWVTILGSTYLAVFLAEVGGDRSLYAIGSLASRLRPAPLYAGIGAAFVLKMLAAVLLGSVVARLPESGLRAVGATSLLLAAAIVWRESAEKGAEPRPRRSVQAVGVAFATVFFSEWADPGQLTAASLSAHYRAPLLVWLGATAALMTKGVLAATIGMRVARALPPARRRNLAFVVLVGLAVLVGLGASA